MFIDGFKGNIFLPEFFTLRALQIFDNLKKANTALGAEVDKEYGLSEVGSDIASEELSYKLENLHQISKFII